MRAQPRSAPRIVYDISLPGYVSGTGNLAISLDSRQIAYVANLDGTAKVWLRPLGSLDARPIAGTDGADGLFWSPDSRFLAFTAGGNLQRVDLGGGGSQTIAPTLFGTAGTWRRDGVVLFTTVSTGRGGISMIGRTTANGGGVTPAMTTATKAASGDLLSVYPRFLPDGNHFLYVGNAAGPLRGTARIGTLEGAAAAQAIDLGTVSQPIEYANGFVLFVRDDTLLAQRIDTAALALRGSATVIADRAAEISVTDDVLVYAEAHSNGAAVGAQGERRLVWVDRHGQPLGEIDAPAGYIQPALSPDERRVAVRVPDPATGTGDIWTIDIARGIKTRLTVDPADDATPVWSPDSARIMFGSGRDSAPGIPTAIYQRAANGTGSDERLFSAPAGELVAPLSWSHDGSYVLFGRAALADVSTKIAIWRLDLTGERTASSVLDDGFMHSTAQISPDGRWIAYTTTESGSTQIVVQSFPDLARDKRQVSIRGGYDPKWRADGRELFYLTPNGTLMSVDVPAGDEFEPGSPTALFETGIAVEATLTGRRPDLLYAVAANGERFLLNRPVAEPQSTGKADAPAPVVHVIVNWSSGLGDR
jgi:Tol biopolymer transport system component